MGVIRTIGVIGAGTMGRGIAELAARNGFSVTVHDAADNAEGEDRRDRVTDRK